MKHCLLEKPDLLALMAQQLGFFPALLESQSFNPKIGRFDILFAAPSVQWVVYQPEQLEAMMQMIDNQSPDSEHELPFEYGWFVYFAYEAGLCFEPSLAKLFDGMSEPLAVAIYCQGAVVYDHLEERCYITAKSEQVLNEITASLKRAKSTQAVDCEFNPFQEEPGEHFVSAVKEAKKWIRSGDIYQANLSRQWQIKAGENIDEFEMFRRLRRHNPAPFAGIFSLPEYAVVSSSPERLLSVSDGWVETRPIAGTRPRGGQPNEDEQLQRELIGTIKERAEHLMLIDLERNDVGRVCEAGSVEVDELMVIESYEHVHHIVSNVKGRLKPDLGVADVIRALFPGGTITGCPKIRCMELIHEIENKSRGCYTGSMGYINHDGQVDLNILIRSMAIQGDELRFHAGAGIVFDSEPEAELQETRHKAKGLVRAVENA